MLEVENGLGLKAKIFVLGLEAQALALLCAALSLALYLHYLVALTALLTSLQSI